MVRSAFTSHPARHSASAGENTVDTIVEPMRGEPSDILHGVRGVAAVPISGDYDRVPRPFVDIYGVVPLLPKPTLITCCWM